MKTAEKPMTQELLKIVNPVRVMKVEEWIKMAEFLDRAIYSTDTFEKAYQLQTRYEALTSQPLKKSMFVCEVEEPKAVPDGSGGVDFEGVKAYTKAQESLWFEGFDSAKGDSKLFHTSGMELFTGTYIPSQLWVSDKKIHDGIETVFDLIIEISRYNRTAKEPITINFTENFCKELLK